MARIPKKEKKQSVASGIGVGGSSIMAVFVILCLTTFATLSLVSAQADLRLSKRSAESVILYYSADAQAQQLLAELSALLGETTQYDDFLAQAVDIEQVTEAVDSGDAVTVSLAIPLDDTRSLLVEASLTYGQPCRISRYSVAATSADEVTLGDNMDVWDGKVPM